MNDKENASNNLNNNEEVNKESKINKDSVQDNNSNNDEDKAQSNNNEVSNKKRFAFSGKKSKFNNKKSKLNESSLKTDNKLKINPKLKEFTKTKLFKVASYLLVFILGIIISSSGETPTMTNEEIEAVMAENTSYKNDLEEANTELSEANDKIDELNEKIESAQPWFEMEENEREEVEKANEEKRLAEEAEAKKKEEEEQKAKEEEEKKGYDTGITYGQLARNPDDYKGKKVKFEGKVIQVMEGDGETQIRLAVNGSYDNVIYGVYDSDIVESRILEDDYITVYGNSAGLLTYTSTMGGEITIPSMLVVKIDQ